MTQNQPALPKWIMIVSVFLGLMEMIVSVYLCVDPHSVIETVDLTAKGVDYIIYMWATRQFAFGFILAFATLKKSAPMLTIAYIFMLVMFIGDFFVGISQHENALIISAVVMCIVSLALLYFVNRRK